MSLCIATQLLFFVQIRFMCEKCIANIHTHTYTHQPLKGQLNAFCFTAIVLLLHLHSVGRFEPQKQRECSLCKMNVYTQDCDRIETKTQLPYEMIWSICVSSRTRTFPANQYFTFDGVRRSSKVLRADERQSVLYPLVKPEINILFVAKPCESLLFVVLDGNDACVHVHL